MISCLRWWETHLEDCRQECNVATEEKCPFIKERGGKQVPKEEETEVCAICGDKHGTSAVSFNITKDGDDVKICQSCADTKTAYCSWCNERVHIDSLDRHDLCPSCQDETFVCDSCGDRFQNDDYGSDGECQSCEDEREHESSDGLYEYHGYPENDWRFHHLPTETDPNLYFGVELETDRYEDRHSCLKRLESSSINYKDFCYPSEDSSLSNGIEFVCQPATLKYHQTKFPWEQLTDIITRSGGKSHQTQTCGLHIHFSKEFYGADKTLNDLNQLKTIYLVNHFWEEFAVLARRKTGFARKYEGECFDKLPLEKIQGMRRGADNYYGHGNAVNITPDHTIELRLFKGTLKPETIKASIELADYIAHYVIRAKTSQLKYLEWIDFIKGAEKADYLYLPAYLKEHNLHSETDGKITKIEREN